MIFFFIVENVDFKILLSRPTGVYLVHKDSSCEGQEKKRISS